MHIFLYLQNLVRYRIRKTVLHPSFFQVKKLCLHLVGFNIMSYWEYHQIRRAIGERNILPFLYFHHDGHYYIHDMITAYFTTEQNSREKRNGKHTLFSDRVLCHEVMHKIIYTDICFMQRNYNIYAKTSRVKRK